MVRPASSRPFTAHRKHPPRSTKKFVSPFGSTCTAARPVKCFIRISFYKSSFYITIISCYSLLIVACNNLLLFLFILKTYILGQLHVYIKPESKKMSELKPVFIRSGDQGNHWRQGYISLDTVTENFQVNSLHYAT